LLGFFLALLPLLIVLAGIVWLRQSGGRMAIVGWLAACVLACTYFKTPISVALGATAFGIVKALAISVAVVFTMLMIFVMREAGALKTIADAIKRIAATREEQALFIGMGFGSFVTALGALTTALFPPLLVAIGFPPLAAISVAVLGYDPLTSFALLSLPITIPAGASGHLLGAEHAFTAEQLALKIAYFLPLVSVGLALAMLWIIGGFKAIRRGLAPALISGLVISLSALGFIYFELIPVQVVGIASGLLSMLALVAYQKLARGRRQGAGEQPRAPIAWLALLRAAAPWLLLIAAAAVISFPEISKALAGVLGQAEVIPIFGGQQVDMNILAQMYFWILVALLLSLPILRPTGDQLKRALKVWIRRIWEPFIAFSVYFSIAYVMFFSAMEVTDAGTLAPGPHYATHNMDVVVGGTLAQVFGIGFVFIASALGLFGAVVGGSETASNMMFMKIQHKASLDLGLSADQFLTIFGAHATGGGIASAMTPAKINSAAAMIEPDKGLEGRVMRKHMVVAVLLTIATGIVTGVIVGFT
jgi:lactate permease